MKDARDIWRYTLEEPFSWIRDCIFQPAKFDREFGKETQAQRMKSMLRLTLPMFLIFYPFGLVARAIFIALHLIPLSDIIGFLLTPFIGIVLGIAGGILFGIVLGVLFDIALGIAAGIVLDILVGIAGGTAFGMADGIAGGIAGGIA